LKATVRFFFEEIEDLIHFLQCQYADFFDFELRPSEFYICVANEWIEKDPFMSYKVKIRETKQDVLAAG